MKNARIDTIYISLIRKPWCFAVRRKLQSDHFNFEVVKVSSLPDLLTELLGLLNCECPNFVDSLDRLDNEQLKKSSHRTVPYFDADHAPKWRQCLPATIGLNEARAIAGLACDAAGVGHKSINLRLHLVLDE